MSTSEGPSPVEGLDTLEAAVEAAVARIQGLEEELRRTQTRRDEVEALLQRMNTGEESPAHMARELKALQVENQELRRRLGEGKAVVERLLARVNYLEAHG